MSLAPPPTASDPTEKGGKLTMAWLSWFSRLFAIASTVASSGTTAQRPIATNQIPLMIGQSFFDTTLGLPVWVKSLNPTVWVNSAGAPV
jgi:hypothetical protein